MKWNKAPSRLYGLSTAGYIGKALAAIFFHSFGFISLALVIHSFISENFQVGQYIGGSLMALGVIFIFNGFGSFLWRSIPPRVKIADYTHAKKIFSKQRFFLILWSFHQYHDYFGSERLGFNKDAGGRVEADVSLDSKVREVAQKFGHVTIKLWNADAPEPLGDMPKSIHVICDDSIWQQVITMAFSLATGIVVFSGSGQGLNWEVEQILNNPSLSQKSVIADSSLSKDTQLRIIDETLERVTKRTKDLVER
jgi:hypothetical protein